MSRRTLPDLLADDRLFLTVADVAAVLNTDPRTVRRGIDAGTIPAVRVTDATIRIPRLTFLRDVCGVDPQQSAEPTGKPRLVRISEPEKQRPPPAA